MYADNHEANHWGLYANNRIAQARPQYAPLLAYLPKARQQAAFYNCTTPAPGPCPGIHLPGAKPAFFGANLNNISKKDRFTKIGSGQTLENFMKHGGVFRRSHCPVRL
jgi:hypothetical protein